MNTAKWLAMALALIFCGLSSRGQDSPTIEVTGSATLSIVPDRITIEIGLEEYFKRTGADSAKVKISEIERQVRQTLKKAGVVDSLIALADMGNYANPAQSATFLMAKRLSAVVTDFAQFDKLAASLPESGITSFQITKLDNSDMERYNREGLKAALDAARSKASFIAANEGLKGILIWKVEETSPRYAQPLMFSNVAYESGSGMESMHRIERRYEVRATYLSYYK